MRRDLAELMPLLEIAGSRGDTETMLGMIVRAVRTHLSMDVGFVSQFNGDMRNFRIVDAKGASPIQQGAAMAMEDGYCAQVVLGKVPELIPNTASVAAAMAIPDTRELPIGAHLSVPIRLKNGQLYGTFCCFSHLADETLNERDLSTMKAFAEVIAFHVEAEMAVSTQMSQRRDILRRAMSSGDPHIVFQPVVQLSDRAIVGHEALARFDTFPPRTPDLWFAEATEIGMVAELDCHAMLKAAVAYGNEIAHSKRLLHLNCNPETLVERNIADELNGFPLDRVVLELTEHREVSDYHQLRHALEPLRRRGVKIAVDDAGAGYSSMRHVLLLQPDIIKLDISLVRDIDTDTIKHALGMAVCGFARQTNCAVIAEGVESAGEVAALTDLGVDQAQGYFFGRPAALFASS